MDLSQLVEGLGDALVVVDREWRIVLANAAARRLAELLGAPLPEQPVGRSVWDLCPLPEEVERAARTAMRRGASEVLEVRHAAADRWLDVRLDPVGEGVGIICRDITDRRRAEADLRRSQAALAEAQALAHLGSWEWDVQADRVVWSDEMYRLYGREPHSAEIRYDGFLALVHPDDRARVDDLIGRAFESGAPFDFQHRVITPDGSERVLLAHGDVVRDAGGSAVRMRGTALDVTDRSRAAEAALSQGAELLRAVVEGTTDSIFVKDLVGRYVMLNAAAAERFGRSAAEAIGLTDRDLFPRAVAARLQANDRAVLRAGTTRSYEESLPSPDGDRVELVSKGLYRDAEGQPAGIIGIGRNITQRKQQEERQRLVAEASRLLTTSLDFEVTLARVARVALPSFADYCLVDLMQPDGSVQRVEMAHADPAREAALRETALRFGPAPSSPGNPIAAALSTGEVVYRREVDLDAFAASMPDPDFALYLRRLAPISLISAPLALQGAVLGALTFCRADSGRRYTPEDVAVARELADRAALAVQNARLYRAAQAEIAQRAHAELALRKWADIFEHAGWGVMMTDRDGMTLVSMNPAFARLHGCEATDLAGRPVADVLAPDAAGVGRYGRHVRAARAQGRQIYEGRHRDREGRSFPVLVDLAAVKDERGEVLYYAANVQDLTERHRAEEQLRQAQKMEALGRLAGGVAHDFNNMLMIIIGFSDFLLAALNDDDRRHADALEIRRAAERASSLTRQLLAFGGPQQQRPGVVDLNAVVDDMGRMLRPLLGEAITLATVAGRPLAGVEADRGQIEQVIMNLALNARDAMPAGGELAIETHDAELGEGEAYRQVGIDIPAGAYVMLVVRDTGFGMDEPVRSRVFEPFFTTKGSSRNSGLGLATVYGIVTQSGGYIWFDSAPGQGTVFRICFPAATAGAGDGDAAAQVAPARGGDETVLVVEDEASVRSLAVRALEEQGYRVLSAGNGRAALHLLESRPAQPVDLLVTDVVMPEMGGRELVERALRLRPDLEVLFISGYTNTEGPGRDLRDTGFSLLQKPFSPESLVRRVRELLDTRTSAAPRP